MLINEICKLEFGHIRIAKETITCEHCGEMSFELSHGETFFDHLYFISGFIQAHKNCKT